jgi:hypothetical protein
MSTNMNERNDEPELNGKAINKTLAFHIIKYFIPPCERV